MATCFSIQPSCSKRLVRRKQVAAERCNLSANAMLLMLASACKAASNCKSVASKVLVMLFKSELMMLIIISVKYLF